jgi:hypothetical protein
MRKLSETHEINDPIRLSSLKHKLCSLAENYTFELEFSIPQTSAAKAGVLYKDKIKWLRKNVNAPAAELSKSLSGENLPWLSQFPNLNARSVYPSFFKIRQQLRELLEWSDALERSVQAHLTKKASNQAPAARPITDLKYALAFDLVELYAECTGKTPSLITRATVHKDRKQITDSKTLSFVRLTAHIILGDPSAQMHDETRKAIKKYRPMRS